MKLITFLVLVRHKIRSKALLCFINKVVTQESENITILYTVCNKGYQKNCILDQGLLDAYAYLGEVSNMAT